MSRREQPPVWLYPLLLLAAGAAVFFAHDDSLRETAFIVLLYIVLVSSLNIFLGFTGYVNFGHIVFFGLGGYTAMYFLTAHAWSLFAAALAGGFVASALAVLLGMAVLRLRGAYFALATIGVNEAARAFVNNFGPFGGATGLSLNFVVYQKYGGPAQALWFVYGLMLAVALAVVIVSLAIKRSRFGLGLLAIREDEDAAQTMGVDAPLFKTLAYAVSAFFPGVVGALYFFKNGNIEPGDAFRLHMSIESLVMIMLGGQGTVLGPLVGALGYERLRGLLLTSDLFKNMHLVFAGGALLLIVLFIPQGIVGALRHRFTRLRRYLE
ncbi:MAG: branched-chain amino acid ABC transporter permease [Myxococcales bacterium]|nr:branched-chain amino acid ABC transporter permease [Myxococcales bacterium]